MTNDDAKAIALAASRMRAFAVRMLADLEALGLTPEQARDRFNEGSEHHAAIMNEFVHAARARLARRVITRH